MDARKIATLPLDGRNFIPLVTLSPGVALPNGHYYGRVGTADVPALVAALREKRIAAEYYRGCGGWIPPVQAAEIALRLLGRAVGRLGL